MELWGAWEPVSDEGIVPRCSELAKVHRACGSEPDSQAGRVDACCKQKAGGKAQ